MKTRHNFMLALFFSGLLALCLYRPAAVNADDGWVARMRSDTGPVYSVVDHPDISLLKEVLIYNDTSYMAWNRGGAAGLEVHFLFGNSSDKEVQVKAAFPVKVQFPVVVYPFEPPDGRVEFEDDFGADFINGSLGIAPKWNDFGMLNIYDPKKLIVAKSVSTSPVAGVSSLEITQDGRHVAVEDAFLKTELIPPYSDANPGTDPKTVSAMLVGEQHYLHTLVFPPKADSHVVFRYDHAIQTGESGGMSQTYDWKYVLGTARTWHGSVDRLFLSLPKWAKPQLPKEFERAGVWNLNALYLAKAYEPRETDEIVTNRKTELRVSPGRPDALLAEPQTVPAQAFLKISGASSALPGKTNIYRVDPDTVYPDPEKGIRNLENIVTAGFGPLSLFDGIGESAWCEGAPGDGAGEWVGFELAEDVHGLEVKNGFLKYSQEPILMGRAGRGFLERVGDAYGNNGRPRTIEIASVKGGIKLRLDLKDTPETQVFAKADLPKGAYRITIVDAYPGKKFHDTCLGELSFRIADDFLHSVLNPGDRPW